MPVGWEVYDKERPAVNAAILPLSRCIRDFKKPTLPPPLPRAIRGHRSKFMGISVRRPRFITIVTRRTAAAQRTPYAIISRYNIANVVRPSTRVTTTLLETRVCARRDSELERFCTINSTTRKAFARATTDRRV